MTKDYLIGLRDNFQTYAIKYDCQIINYKLLIEMAEQNKQRMIKGVKNLNILIDETSDDQK